MENKSINNTKKVAKNTLYLYLRTFLVMTISIYTSRVVLDVLGVDNYGIYNVVGGFVSLFSVFSGTLTAATQRFIAFELGKDKPQIAKVFSTAINIHIIMALLLFVLLETIGIWFLYNKMNIVPERRDAAMWVFQCSTLTFCISLISIPYNAAIIAYEKMSAFAYISVIEVVAKLILVYLLYITSSDPLVTYAIMMLFVAVALRMVYSLYCRSHFRDCKYSLLIDRVTFKDIFCFNAWNFIGSSASVMNGHGINILINLFFGVAFNAAKGIATQIDGAINSFVQNFMMALNPQIVKSYASRDFESFNRMILWGTKYAFFLLACICFPVLLNIDFILSIWLVQVPAYTAIFVRCAIVFSLCQSLSQCLYSAMLATGRIKNYQIVVGGISLMAFPLCYLFFKLGFTAEYVYVATIICSLLCLVARLYMLKGMIPGFSPRMYFNRTIYPIIRTIIPVLTLIYVLSLSAVEVDMIVFIVQSCCCLLICVLGILFIGMSSNERVYLLNTIKRKIVKK